LTYENVKKEIGAMIDLSSRKGKKWVSRIIVGFLVLAMVVGLLMYAF
jgi:hypothetical protein